MEPDISEQKPHFAWDDDHPPAIEIFDIFSQPTEEYSESFGHAFFKKLNQKIDD